jgi:GGDEF domain-containing protein
LFAVGCSRTPHRSVASFCGQLGKDRSFLVLPMSTPEQITAMVARYRELDTRAPEEIRDDWSATTELIAKAAASDLSTATQQADLVKLAYATDKSVKSVVKYSKETCGVDFSPGATVSLPPTTVAGG